MKKGFRPCPSCGQGKIPPNAEMCRKCRIHWTAKLNDDEVECAECGKLLTNGQVQAMRSRKRTHGYCSQRCRCEDDRGAKYLPSRKEIEAAKKVIQARWSMEERWRRRVEMVE